MLAICGRQVDSRGASRAEMEGWVAEERVYDVLNCNFAELEGLPPPASPSAPPSSTSITPSPAPGSAFTQAAKSGGLHRLPLGQGLIHSITCQPRGQ